MPQMGEEAKKKHILAIYKQEETAEWLGGNLIHFCKISKPTAHKHKFSSDK